MDSAASANRDLQASDGETFENISNKYPLDRPERNKPEAPSQSVCLVAGSSYMTISCEFQAHCHQTERNVRNTHLNIWAPLFPQRFGEQDTSWL